MIASRSCYRVTTLWLRRNTGWQSNRLKDAAICMRYASRGVLSSSLGMPGINISRTGARVKTHTQSYDCKSERKIENVFLSILYNILTSTMYLQILYR